MSTLAIGLMIVVLIMIALYVANWRLMRTSGILNFKGNVPRGHITQEPKFLGLIEEKVVPFDGLPNGEIYDTVENTASAATCATLCTEDKNCDSFSYTTLDGLCQKKRNTANANSTSYWKAGKNQMVRVPGRALQANMLREQVSNNADECAQVCLTDGTCSVADFNETSKTCRLGSVIRTKDIVSGVIPARRTAVDLASN